MIIDFVIPQKGKYTYEKIFQAHISGVHGGFVRRVFSDTNAQSLTEKKHVPIKTFPRIYLYCKRAKYLQFHIILGILLLVKMMCKHNV